MVAKYALRDTPLRGLIRPNCIDSIMMIDWDQPYAVDKSRNAGFIDTIDSPHMFTELFNVLRDVRAIP